MVRCGDKMPVRTKNTKFYYRPSIRRAFKTDSLHFSSTSLHNVTANLSLWLFITFWNHYQQGQQFIRIVFKNKNQNKFQKQPLMDHNFVLKRKSVEDTTKIKCQTLFELNLLLYAISRGVKNWLDTLHIYQWVVGSWFSRVVRSHCVWNWLVDLSHFAPS